MCFATVIKKKKKFNVIYIKVLSRPSPSISGSFRMVVLFYRPCYNTLLFCLLLFLFSNVYMSHSSLYLLLCSYFYLLFSIFDTMNLYRLHCRQFAIDSPHSSLQYSICFRYMVAVLCRMYFLLFGKKFRCTADFE